MTGAYNIVSTVLSMAPRHLDNIKWYDTEALRIHELMVRLLEKDLVYFSTFKNNSYEKEKTLS